MQALKGTPMYGPDGTGGGTAADDAEAAEITKIEEDKRTPAQKRIVQLVSQRKAADARVAQAEADAAAKVALAEAKQKETEDKLAAKEASDKAKSDQAEIAAAKSAEDFQKIQDRLQKERDAEKATYEQKIRDQQAAYDVKESQRQQVALDRAGQSILHALAVTNKMTDPADIDLFDVELEINPETFELTQEGKKKMDDEFAKFKKSKPHLFEGGRKTVTPPDGHRSRVLPASQDETKKPDPMALIAEGFRQKQAGA